jgi:hypothetical protein
LTDTRGARPARQPTQPHPARVSNDGLGQNALAPVRYAPRRARDRLVWG